MILLITAALAGLQPGATIRLPPGPQPTIEITDRNFSPPVTIDARDAVVNGVRITKSSGIIFRGGTIVAPDGIDGDKPGSHAARLQQFRDVTFDGVTFTSAKHGMVAGNGFGLTVRNSNFVGLRSDGIDTAGNSDVLIERNRFTDNRPRPKIGIRGEPGFIDGDHPDAVQIWNTPMTRSARNIIVRDNFIDGEMQGITTYGDQGEGYENIVVENNRINVTFPAAIAVIRCKDCRIRYNTVTPADGARFPVNVRAVEAFGLFCDNKMPARPTHKMTAKCGQPAQTIDPPPRQPKPAAVAAP